MLVHSHRGQKNNIFKVNIFTFNCEFKSIILNCTLGPEDTQTLGFTKNQPKHVHSHTYIRIATRTNTIT